MLTCGGKDHVLRAGAGFVFQPGDRIEASHDPRNPLVVFACHFLRAKPKGEVDRFLRGCFYYSVNNIDHAGRSAEMAAQVYEERPAGRQFAAAVVGQLVAQALLLSKRRSVGHPADEKLAALALEIRSGPGAKWDVPSMARRCALSTPQFNRRFKRAFGTSSQQFVFRERIERAATLLRETELSIKEIAEALGYRDVFYFHRQFRQLLDRTPREIRLSARTDCQTD